MATTLQTSLEGCVDSTLHSIPAEVDYNGDANVCKYFTARATHSHVAGECKATFRGRPLLGKEVDVPSGYKGLVINEKGAAASDQQDRTLIVEKTFEKFMCWNLETSPSFNTFDWLGLANVVHSPINVDDEEDAVKSSPDER